jgi:TolB-like protein
VYVDFEHSLNKTIHTLRTALDDSPTSPRYIETVAGRGYRFIPAMNTPTQVSGLRTSRKIDSVAVLPFIATDASPEIRFIACQVAAQLTHALSGSPGLRVLAHSTVKYCDTQGKSPRMIGELLGVRAVIFAELSNGGNELSLNVELIEVPNGLQLWGSQFRQLGFDCSERIVRRIVRQLQPALLGEFPKPLTRAEKKPPAEIRIMKSISAKRCAGLVMA